MGINTQYEILATRAAVYIDSCRIFTDEPTCFAYGTDASFYRLTPKIVIKVNDEQELKKLIQDCWVLDIAYTYRAAGTSLSGQSVTDSLLIMLTEDWQRYQILDNGERIKLQPGVIGADANRHLAPYLRKIGPDPASINTCKIGGIAANNASGMCCGVEQNSYKTIDNIRVILFDGTILDTSCKESVANFISTKKMFIDQLVTLQSELYSNKVLVSKIKKKYKIKNTSGYSINSLVDYDDPIEMIKHLMIGSEGTLGFISEITYNTVENNPFKATSLYIYSDVESAVNALQSMKSLPIVAAELMDGAALSAVKHHPQLPEFIRGLDSQACALLIETSSVTYDLLQKNIEKIEDYLSKTFFTQVLKFTREPQEIAMLWSIRKGLFPSVGAVRKAETTVIIEDVAFELLDLAEGIRDLHTLFKKFNYDEAIIFGHALEGNIHFVFTQKFDSKTEIERYECFMSELANIVAVKYGGSLKAEHGTGRNMAPFVELEWGKDAYYFMKKIKEIFDPKSLINPGVIINTDPFIHIKNLKNLPTSSSIIDKCIECGFCEPICPSNNLSFTPRQRITVYREMQRLKNIGAVKKYKEFSKVFDYKGDETCAATSLCKSLCPVGIDTGELIRSLRSYKNEKYGLIAKWTSNHIGGISQVVRVGLSANKVVNSMFDKNTTHRISKGLKHFSAGYTPLILPELPKPNPKLNSRDRSYSTNRNVKKVVYFPSCASRTFGTSSDALDQRSLTEVSYDLLSKAGFEIVEIKDVEALCCGLPWQSKGFSKISTQVSKRLERILFEATDFGKYPVLMDTSPCVYTSVKLFKSNMSIYEPFEFALNYLVPNLNIQKLNQEVMLHVTCSSQNMGLTASVRKLANLLFEVVNEPNNIHCCGWSGDKGFFVPELNSSALSKLKQQVPSSCSVGISNSLTCEMGLSHHSGIHYSSIFYALDQASSNK